MWSMSDKIINEQDDVIVLVDPNGKEVRFEFVDVIERDDKMYAILHPLDELDGIEDDTCVIFNMDVQDDDSVLLNPIEDEAELNAVYEQYVQLCESDCDCEEDGEECCDDDCECGCREGGECGCNCDKE
ncbi:MAG: DUF1292 domain-containing protein [Clostridia bacterium]|nr:DUF1292 domain-containing protein [Clostridia bacterium]